MLLGLFSSCIKTKYICPAYQSAFQLEMYSYKRDKLADSLATAADTNAFIDVVMTLAERIRLEDKIKEEADPNAEPVFPVDNVFKTEYLLIKKVKKKAKLKLLATVPMITIFPASLDSTAGEETEVVVDEEKSKKKKKKRVLAQDQEEEEAKDSRFEEEDTEKKEPEKDAEKAEESEPELAPTDKAEEAPAEKPEGTPAQESQTEQKAAPEEPVEAPAEDKTEEEPPAEEPKAEEAEPDKP